ncbi:polymorphic toxin type 15 domain-containing protein [Dyadobacter sandarakinus]|uniref:Novel toxin 15 domain-containing protein n=1 Tax=Dyadobacter sandarakinus TaxID=2747268 RepID=A0ABX7I5Z8_9BACT|nr:polymorphic toxin type 15 domain-containing protein [Dyadobacter sandarakinus]QRR00603.1 hypothetical protein HWI92_06625 [Dyadobacter sandarakinus]
MAEKATLAAPKKAVRKPAKPFFAAVLHPKSGMRQPQIAAGLYDKAVLFPLKSIAELSRNRKPGTVAPTSKTGAPAPVNLKPTQPVRPARKILIGGSRPAAQVVPKPAQAGPADQKDAPVPATSAVKAPARPSEDPDFKALNRQVKQKAGTQKKHGLTADKLHEGKVGAVAPKGEKLAHAKGSVVEEMSETKVKPKIFDRNDFLRQFDKQIRDALPKSKGEMERFANTREPHEPAEIQSLKGSVTSGVKQAKNDATQPIAVAAAQTPQPGNVIAPEFKELKKEQPGAVPVVESTDRAAPKPRLEGEVSMEKEAAALDTQMQDGGVSQDQLQTSNEEAFMSAEKSKTSAQEKARQVPEVYRQAETPALEARKAEAEDRVSGQMTLMNKFRSGLFGGVDKQKHAVKSKNELMRERIRKQLEDIYDQTKSTVEAQLSALELAVTTRFVLDLALATQKFKNNVDRKIGDLGITDSISDFFTGSDSKQEVFDEEKTRFEADLRATINIIADKVEAGLKAAMQTIRDGRGRVATEVDKMNPEEQKIGKEIQGDIDEKFTALEGTVEQKQGELAESLAKKYVEGVSELNAIFEKIKEEHMGWLEKAAWAIKNVISTIAELKDMLLNVLAKAGSVIMSIIKHPIRFVKNLVSAVKLGLSNFKKNIWKHLKEGFFAWLLGSLPPGVEIPKDWELISIFKFAASILGLTWINIRSRAVKKIGEPMVRAMETTFDIFMVIIKEGLGGLWRLIKEKFNNLKAMVIDAVLDFLKERVIMAGVAWIIGLMNPAGAFIKACKAIYDIIKFFIERGKQILEFVNSVLDSIAEIVAGKIAPAAQRVEDSLAKAIPIAIGFLASLLGLGGLSEKVLAIIKKVQDPVNLAIDWILDKAIAFGKKLGVDKLEAKAKEGVNKGKEWAKDKVAQGKEKVAAAAGKFLGWLKIRKGFTDKTGESHTLYFEGHDEQADLMVASKPKPAKKLLKEIGATPDGKKVYNEILTLINKVGSLKLKITTVNEKEENDKVMKQISDLVACIGALFATVSIAGKTTEMTEVEVKFDVIYPTLTREYARQLKEQQLALNAMLISKWLVNRSVFENKGRIPDSTLRQQVNDDFRKKAEFRASMQKRGLKDEKEIDKLWKYSQAATHKIDQVAGGDHNVFTDVGVSSVNSHIGSQWKSRVALMVKAVGEVNPEVYGTQKMKVKLSTN